MNQAAWLDDEECSVCGEFAGTNLDCPKCEDVRRADAKTLKREAKELYRGRSEEEEDSRSRR